MTDSAKNPLVDAYINKATHWAEEIRILRSVLLGFQLTEKMKWGKPCYSLGKGNVAIIFPFKEYCAIGFFKGSLIKDPDGVLAAPGEHSQAMREIRFTGTQEIKKMDRTLKACISEAIGIEKAGLKVKFAENPVQEIPGELRTRMKKNPALKNAFSLLTPGRQRAYILYFSQAKQSKTRETRIEKYEQHIIDGKGMDD